MNIETHAGMILGVHNNTELLIRDSRIDSRHDSTEEERQSSFRGVTMERKPHATELPYCVL